MPAQLCPDSPRTNTEHDTRSLSSQIGGTTLHSFAGIGTGAAVISTCVQLAKRKTVAAQWRKCKHLIIDEVSLQYSA